MASAVLLAYPSVTPASTLQSFDVVNFDGVSSSDGFIRVGLPFKYGDVSTGNIPKIEKSGVEVTAVQFDERTFWSDGSLRYCVLHMRDSTFSASESRTYDVKTKSGSYSNTATFATSAITGTYDLKTQITSLTQPNQSNTNNHTASLNTAFGTATRVTKIHSGPICDGWMVWQYYNDDSDSTDDTHLKAVWYVDIWNDGSDTDQGYIEFGCKTCLNNWDTANKDRHDYTLTLKNSTTTIETYSTIQHPYHAEWLTVSKGNDNNDGRRHWLSTAPTLYVKPDQAYWISTGLIPPLDTSISTTGANDYNTAWAPCDNMDHRANIDGTGAYAGRGIITNIDATCFLTQTAAHTRYARVNAHAGLHVGYHFKSTASRDRSSKSSDAWNNFSAEGSDEANTNFSFILDPKTSGAYTFTSDGMPAATHAYKGGTATYQGGYTSYTGGDGVWSLSNTASHAVNYSYYLYLLEGERYFLDATVDLAMAPLHRSNGNVYAGRPRTLWYESTNHRSEQTIPSTTWGAVGVGGTLQERSFGWQAMLLGSAYAIVPDNDVQANCVRAWVDHNGDYATDGVDYLPADQAAWGLYYYNENVLSPWMIAIQTLGFWHWYNCSRDADVLAAANITAKFPVRLWDTTRYYQTIAYRGLVTESVNEWHPTTNTFRAYSDYMVRLSDVTTTASTDNCAISAQASGSTIADDDRVVFTSKDEAGATTVIPTGITEGTDYYLISTSGLNFKVSETSGGGAVDITSDETNAYVYAKLADYVATPATGAQYLPPEDSYSPILYAALVAANSAGNADATDTLVTNAASFLQNVTVSSGWYTWRYAS